VEVLYDPENDVRAQHALDIDVKRVPTLSACDSAA